MAGMKARVPVVAVSVASPLAQPFLSDRGPDGAKRNPGFPVAPDSTTARLHPGYTIVELTSARSAPCQECDAAGIRRPRLRPSTRRHDDAIPFPDPGAGEHRPETQRKADGRHGPIDDRDDRGRNVAGYRGAAADLRWQARAFVPRQADGFGRSVHRIQGSDRRLRVAPGRFDGTRAAVDEAIPGRARRRVGSRVRAAADRSCVRAGFLRWSPPGAFR